MVGPATDFAPPGAERLEVRPPVDPIEMKALLRQARVVALPSRAEGMPLVLTEAMSLGRPFVSTPVGGIPELAGGGGILVPVDDEIGLADRLTDLLADPGLARTIGERGRRFCLETRSVQVIDARLRKLYSAAAADKTVMCSGAMSLQRGVSGARIRRVIVSPYLPSTPTQRPSGDLRPPPRSVPRLLVQDLGWGQQLAPHERAEATPGRQQPVDQSHVGIELGLAGVRVGVREPHSHAFAKAQLGHVPEEPRSPADPPSSRPPRPRPE